MGRVLGSLIVIVVLVVGVAWAFGLVNLQQTRDAHLPAVSLQGGQLPKFDADVAKVNVGKKSESVSVPKIDIGTTEQKVEVPSVSVDKPAK